MPDNAALKDLEGKKVSLRRGPPCWIRIVSVGVVLLAAGHRVRRQEPGRSAGDHRKADGWIIAQRRDGFQRHVTGGLDGPFIVLLEQDRADEANDSVLIGEGADHLGPPLDLAVETLVGLVQCSLVRCCGGKHVGEYIGLSLVQEGSDLGVSVVLLPSSRVTLDRRVSRSL
jgi:hypothetical protein